ncbi:hypothetical protein B296_00007074 [Ensete ventricosum]|uniref:Uncharacterized protein n=1 Tax=Ensete ventricosum TaxID=4639 RepID=A0A426ZC74_ENSVE|nr:hypothetical protein B296_00007074 [Ensete ventricosum]
MAVASAIGDSKHGRMAIAYAIDDFRRGRAATSSPLSVGRPRARNGDDCAAISVGRVVAPSTLGGWRSLGRGTPWMRAARCRTLLHIPLLCSSGMLLCWLLPSGLHWLLHSGTPLSNNRWFLHTGRELLLFSSRWLLSNSRWLLHSGRGLLLSRSYWFLPSGLGRFHTRMFHRWFLIDGMLLQ